MGEAERPSRLALGAGICAGGVALLAVLICTHGFVRSGPNKASSIFYNLNLLSSAKDLWAAEHHQSGAVLVTREDIAPYLRGFPGLDGWIKPVAGERYLLKALTEPPEARLTREFEGLPAGTVFSLGAAGPQIILPDARAAKSPAQGLRFQPENQQREVGDPRR
jgi:hypothetical protein